MYRCGDDPARYARDCRLEIRDRNSIRSDTIESELVASYVTFFMLCFCWLRV